MASLPFGKLQPHRPRTFVPEQMEVREWSQLERLFNALETRLQRCCSADELERWLMDWSELNAVLDEEGARRYIAMTCNTEDAEAEKAYLDFVEEIEPKAKPRQFELARSYVNHSHRKGLSRWRYEVFDRDTEAQVKLFRPENVPLETEDARLSQQYQKLTGSLTVTFDGKEQTLIQMGRYLEETDRTRREEAWGLIARRRLAEKDNFEALFDQMVSLRHRIALNAGFDDYRAYMFRKLNRFEYTPGDCERFHAAVERQVMPALRELHEQRRAQLGLDTLRPWDLAVDPLGREPLRPFVQVEDLVARTAAILGKVDPELAADFVRMRELGLLDLENRKGKAPGGYQSTLAEARLPFIFMNAVGLQGDVETILHEAGHAFHALATQNENLHAYRNPPIEICEVASMSMELLGNEHLEEFYSEADANRARKRHLESIIEVLAWIALVDAFQHWVYTHPEHGRSDRARAWTDLFKRFSGLVDWSGYEEEEACLWHRQLHIFTHPFYYIEYGIAQLGALQVWANSREDKRRALEQYKAALSMGGSRPLPELFSAAGCRFDFSEQALGPVMRFARRELQKLSSA